MPPTDWNAAFKPYEKMAERSSEWALEAAGQRLLGKVPWVVTEKIHGANFCIVSDGRAIRAARRKALLADREAFFNWREVLDSLLEPVQCVAQTALATDTAAAFACLYGELYGGHYPHPAVPALPGLGAVQTGVWYCPDIRFAAFDLALVNADGARRYLDVERLIEWAARAALPVAEPLHVGTLEQALKFPIEFDSRVPAALGLPKLAQPNPAEGIVIKPWRHVEVPAKNGMVRPLLKRKIARFAEDERFHGAQKWATAGAGDAANPAGAPTAEWLAGYAASLVNVNRVDSAISKIGPVTGEHSRRVGALFRAVLDDVWEQVRLDVPAELDRVSPDEAKAIDAVIRAAIRAEFRVRFRT